MIFLERNQGLVSENIWFVGVRVQPWRDIRSESCNSLLENC